MEILPGEGVALAKVGEHRDVVEGRVGPPVHPGRHSRAVYPTEPMLVLTYAEDETVEIVELGYGVERQAYFDGVQLTYRFMDEVVADLERKGYRADPTGIGFRFEPGFAIFSMASLWARDLDPQATEDDPREIVEGVSVAPYAYFDDASEEEDEDEG
ncbi:hypothetical protein [Dactylosporangium salmoneum]|uniref:hypothetical protein n=1 Tax=Dactylosporangium salmoneum TaxID=53361 RepID=UPI0031D8B33A